jgi:hypothetical protein
MRTPMKVATGATADRTMIEPAKPAAAPTPASDLLAHLEASVPAARKPAVKKVSA